MVGLGGSRVGGQFGPGEPPQFGEFALLACGEGGHLRSETDDSLDAGRGSVLRRFLREQARDGAVERVGAGIDQFDVLPCFHALSEHGTTDIERVIAGFPVTTRLCRHTARARTEPIARADH